MLDRKLDPLGVSDNPYIAEDPARQVKLYTLFRRRLEYLEESYAIWRQAFRTGNAFNKSIQLLREVASGKLFFGDIDESLQLEVRIAFGHALRKRTGHPFAHWNQRTSEQLQQAAIETLAVLPKRRGRPDDLVLRHHLAGTMAAVQDACGRRVTMVKERKDEYGLAFSDNPASRTVRQAMQRIAPDETEPRLALLAHKIRKQYAGKPMRFDDLFPAFPSYSEESTVTYL